MNRLKDLFHKYPITSILLPTAFIIGVGLIFLGSSSGSTPVTTKKVGVIDPIYCVSTQCPGNYTFGTWKPTKDLLFANKDYLVNYDFPVTKCRSVFRTIRTSSRRGYEKVGGFRKIIIITHIINKRSGDECMLKNGLPISTEFFLAFDSYRNQFPSYMVLPGKPQHWEVVK